MRKFMIDLKTGWRDSYRGWLKIILGGHLLLTLVAILAILFSVYLAASINPATGFVVSLLVGALSLFYFPYISLRILFGDQVKRKEHIVGSKYLLFLGVVAAALIIIGFPLANDAVLLSQSEAVDNVDVSDVLKYKGKNVFLGIESYTILHEMSGSYTETLQSPDKTFRTYSYYVAPMFSQGLSTTKLQEIAAAQELCVWVIDPTESRTYFRENTAASDKYLKAVSKALKGKQPTCVPMFLQGYDSPLATFDTSVHYLELLFGLANGLPLFFLVVGHLIGRLSGKKKMH